MCEPHILTHEIVQIDCRSVVKNLLLSCELTNIHPELMTAFKGCYLWGMAFVNKPWLETEFRCPSVQTNGLNV